MGKEIHFIVLGDPKAQKRHRFARRSSYIASIDDSKGDKATFIAQCRQHAPEAPWTGPIGLEIVLTMARPKSHYHTGKHAGRLKSDAPRWHTSKPDCDNLGKLAQDAMNGIFYRDDSQIASVKITKEYGQTPCTAVWLTELEG